MTGMITSPDKWSPPGGETTFQLRDRVLEWYSELPQNGLIVAITNGGPIAALRGSLLNLSVERWVGLIPACGEIVAVNGILRQRKSSGNEPDTNKHTWKSDA